MTLADELFEDLKQFDQIEAIALGGSRAQGNDDAKSDYDVYLYLTAPISEEDRHNLLSQYCERMEIGNHFWEYEDNCTFNDGVDIDILYRNIDDFGNDVARVVEDFQPSNAYTTCMWHNLRTSRIIYDRNGRLASLQKRFDVPYLEPLRDAIIARSMRLLHGSLPSYDAQIMKAANRGDLVSVNHRVAAFLESYFDVIFAYNRLTHPGEKRQVSIALRDAHELPQDFEENLNALLRDMTGDPQVLRADLDRVLEQLNTMLDQPESTQV